jgi:hypothetical protein
MWEKIKKIIEKIIEKLTDKCTVDIDPANSGEDMYLLDDMEKTIKEVKKAKRFI